MILCATGILSRCYGAAWRWWWLWGSLPWLACLAVMMCVTRWETDDAYISYRYVCILLDGHRLVFNPGWPSVDGYINFLWALGCVRGWRR